jgi:hypothetical protein
MPNDFKASLDPGTQPCYAAGMEDAESEPMNNLSLSLRFAGVGAHLFAITWEVFDHKIGGPSANVTEKPLFRSRTHRSSINSRGCVAMSIAPVDNTLTGATRLIGVPMSLAFFAQGHRDRPAVAKKRTGGCVAVHVHAVTPKATVALLEGCA